jgi:hypothetical protein
MLGRRGSENHCLGPKRGSNYSRPKEARGRGLIRAQKPPTAKLAKTSPQRTIHLVMPKASLPVAMSTPLTVSVGCVVLSVRTFATCVPHCVARMRPALCGPHASQPMSRALALALACACARAVCSPARGRGLCPFRRRRRRVYLARAPCVPSPPARPPAALPTCLP